MKGFSANSLALFIFAVFFSCVGVSSSQPLTTEQLNREFSELLQWRPIAQKNSYESAWFRNIMPTSTLDEISKKVGKTHTFTNRHKEHIAALTLVRNAMMSGKRVEDVLRIAGALRDHPHINPKLWIQAFISTKLRRPDMQSIKMPALVGIIPDDFIPREIFKLAQDAQQEECLVLDESFGLDNNEENALWYFREDLMVNTHHWYWHLYYEPLGFPNPGEGADRRGELFAFMHHEIIARYNTERLTLLGTPRVESLAYDYETPVVPYYSHLTDENSGQNYSDRPENLNLTDVYLEGFGTIRVQGQKDLLELVHSDILTGSLIASNGSLVSLDGFTGIEILSEIIEPAVWSINPERYANKTAGTSDAVHGNGHILVSLITPEVPGVMLSTSTAMRDPSFYQHHTAVENVFLEHKNLLKPYTPTGSEFSLKWDNVRVTNLKVLPENEDLGQNNLQTFWNNKEYNFTRGLDYTGNASTPVLICAKHLDHVEFNYEIELESSSVAPENATVHIFIARRYDGNLNRFSMEEQRPYFFGLDHFPVTLVPGNNTVIRNSRDSALTISFNSWTNLDDTIPSKYCGCGLPHYLLLPIGTATGTTFDLFVMVTQGTLESQYVSDDSESCEVAPLWCGIRHEKYPSRHPMGYPFDRRPYSVETNSGSPRVVKDLEEFLDGIPNMSAIQVKIQHLENRQ